MLFVASTGKRDACDKPGRDNLFSDWLERFVLANQVY